ncbi:hypothetical protein E4U53_004550 [Claviceps sorghi]|nr:hypothetical protein E4U53_004550 [Claviceps sorghi]
MCTARKPPEHLKEGDLYLRRWQASDAPALEAAASSSLAELTPWMPWAAQGYTATEAQHFLDQTRKSWEAGSAYDYAVIVDDQPSGSFGLMRPPGEPGDFEIGYWLATRATGRGWATRATAMLIGVARELGASHVRIRHAELNARSAKIPSRLGFTCLGRQEGTRCVLWVLALQT